MRRPGSPHSKQRIPLVGKCRWETRCAAGESTVPEPPGSILETRIPTQNHAAARFTPQQAEEAFVAADVEWNRREGQSKVLCPGPFQERPLHGISYRLSLFGFPMKRSAHLLRMPSMIAPHCTTQNRATARFTPQQAADTSGREMSMENTFHGNRKYRAGSSRVHFGIWKHASQPKTARRPGSPHTPVTPPGSPRSKQRIPLPGKCRWKTRSTAIESTVPEPPRFHFGIWNTHPNPKPRAARFTPQQAADTSGREMSMENTFHGNRKVPVRELLGSILENTHPTPNPSHAARFTPQQAADASAGEMSMENTFHGSRKYRAPSPQVPFLENTHPTPTPSHPRFTHGEPSGYLWRGNVDGNTFHGSRKYRAPSPWVPFWKTRILPQTPVTPPGSPHSKKRIPRAPKRQSNSHNNPDESNPLCSRHSVLAMCIPRNQPQLRGQVHPTARSLSFRQSLFQQIPPRPQPKVPLTPNSRPILGSAPPASQPKTA